jgi:hypothetical protein
MTTVARCYMHEVLRSSFVLMLLSSPRTHDPALLESRATCLSPPCSSDGLQLCARTAEARSVTMAAAGSWDGHRPLSSTPLPPDVEAYQLQKLSEAHALVDEFASSSQKASKTANSSELSLRMACPGPSAQCECDVDLVLFDTWHILMKISLRALPCGTLGCLALLHDADLIVLPKWPGLPHIESPRVPHRYAANDFILQPRTQPYGPFPGADSVHNTLLFTRAAAEVGQTSTAVVWIQSPTDDTGAPATRHRGWAIPPVGRRRKRNVLLGMTQHIRPAAGAAQPAVDGEVYMRGLLPIPAWLIPFWLIRWAAPIFFAKVVPLFAKLSSKFQNVRSEPATTEGDLEQSFIARVAADEDGFYASAVAAGLVRAELLPGPRLPVEAPTSGGDAGKVVDVGVARPSPRSAVPGADACGDASGALRRMHVHSVEVVKSE